MPAIKKYSDLVVWQRAMDLVVISYRLSERFPRAEDYALRQQLRRAAVSIAANVAEGHGRTGIGEFLHHLSVAHGSLMELETLFQVARKLCYVEEQSVLDLLNETEEVGRLLRGLMTSLRARASESIPVVR